MKRISMSAAELQFEKVYNFQHISPRIRVGVVVPKGLSAKASWWLLYRLTRKREGIGVGRLRGERCYIFELRDEPSASDWHGIRSIGAYGARLEGCFSDEPLS